MTEAHSANVRPLNTSERIRAWWKTSIPTGEGAARLSLIAWVIALHNLLEAPRDPVSHALGTPVTGVLAFLALSASVWLLILALSQHPPTWRWLQSRQMRTVALIVTLGAAIVGVRQIGTMAIRSFQEPYYPNDGATLDQFAAEQLLAGHNPYVTTDITAAVCAYQQDPAFTTPLREGPFALQPASQYPSAAERRAAFPSCAAAGAQSTSGFESHLSYPALAFLPLVPLVWAGLPNAVPLTAVCWLALVGLLVFSVPREWRLWVGLLALADVPLLNAAGIADPDVLYILPLFIAWRWRGRGALSTIMLGLALATKQLAWFSAPFYAILVWRERGWRAAVGRLAGASVLFAIVNAPFALNNPLAWLQSVLAPQIDPMFPLGNGVIRLALSGVVPLAPAPVYTALEMLALVGMLIWYWRNCLRTPALGYALATLPLYFAWRSLTTYFYFTALPAFALLLAERPMHTVPARVAPGEEVMTR